MKSGQLILTPWTDRFVKSVEYDNGVAGRLHPTPDIRHVVIDPLRQFGEPVVRSVPTEVIAEQLRAGDRIEMIADLYELSTDQVQDAIRYELLRATALTETAA